jgi:23S rRNA (cytidine1920-2'-O)/16S rRNA (cytidine1409-2'-O)-methyltransferase
MSSPDEFDYVSRAGRKLARALDHFDVDPSGRICADLGSNVGGFVDCLLRRNAAKVYSVDTSKGTLDWSLRRNPRVVVMDKTNATRIFLDEPIDLVTIDVGWTRQQLVVPRAVDLLADGGLILSLIKPHYEANPKQLRRGVLPADQVDLVIQQVVARIGELGAIVEGVVDSPITGDKGNREVIAHIRRA